MAENNQPNNDVRRHHHHRHHRHHHRKFWHWFWIVIGVIVVIVLFVCGMVYKNLRDTTQNMYTPVAKTTKSNKGRNLDNLLAQKKPINILVRSASAFGVSRSL